MNLNMSIYRQLNPRVLVQVGVDLGLLHVQYISNIFKSFHVFVALLIFWIYEL